MAESIPMVAGGTIAPCRFLKVSAAANQTVLQATAATEKLFGVSGDYQKGTPGLTGSDAAVHAVAGDSVQVWRDNDVCLVEAGAAVTAGDFLTSDSVGRAVTATSGDEVGAQAMRTVAGVGIMILVRVLSRRGALV